MRLPHASERGSATLIPDEFITHYMPRLTDAVSVKVAVHFLWLASHMPSGQPPAVRLADLSADEVLQAGVMTLGVAEGNAAEAIEQAADKLIELGMLVAFNDGRPGGGERWLLASDEREQPELRRLEAGAGSRLPEAGASASVLTSAGTPDASAERPNVFRLYEENIGLLTPLLADELKDAERTYPRDWLEDAFRQAVEHNARNWAYVRAILKRWGREGRGDEADRRGRQGDRERDIEGPFSAYIEH